MSVRLYVGNLPFRITDQELEGLFAESGPVVSTNIVTDRDTGRSRGFAFVEMESREGAEAAIQKLNNFEIGGRAIVNEARDCGGSWRARLWRVAAAGGARGAAAAALAARRRRRPGR